MKQQGKNIKRMRSDMSLFRGDNKALWLPDFAMKALEYRNNYFDAVGYGKVCSCAPVFNFVRLLPIGDSTKCQSPKKAKIGVFANRGQQNKPIQTKFGTQACTVGLL